MTPCQGGNGTGPACTGCDGEREGERRKRDTLAMLEARREVFVNRGRRALLGRLMLAGTATADDVMAAVTLPAEIDPRCLGAVPGPLAKAGIIRFVEFVKSARPQRHGSYIQLWELADRDEALRWLARNPDMPDPAPEHAHVVGTLFGPDTLKEQRPAAVTVGR
jgi:hypothetical protein